MADKDNILAIDLGAKKSGLALMTEGFILGKGTIGGFDEWTRLVGELKDFIEKNNVNSLVVGIPYSRSGERARKYQELIRHLDNELDLPIESIDETLTSHEASRRSSGGKLDNDDEEAAKIILEDYVNSRT